MKYLKYVVAAFVLSIGLSCVGVNGVGIVMMNNVKIPILNGIYTSNSVINKTDTSYPQELERKYCLDDIGQNQRAVEVELLFMGQHHHKNQILHLLGEIFLISLL